MNVSYLEEVRKQQEDEDMTALRGISREEDRDDYVREQFKQLDDLDTKMAEVRGEVNNVKDGLEKMGFAKKEVDRVRRLTELDDGQRAELDANTKELRRILRIPEQGTLSLG